MLRADKRPRRLTLPTSAHQEREAPAPPPTPPTPGPAGAPGPRPRRSVWHYPGAASPSGSRTRTLKFPQTPSRPDQRPRHHPQGHERPWVSADARRGCCLSSGLTAADPGSQELLRQVPPGTTGHVRATPLEGADPEGAGEAGPRRHICQQLRAVRGTAIQLTTT